MSRICFALISAAMLWLPHHQQSLENSTKDKSPSTAHSQLAVVEITKIPSEPADGFNAAEPLRCDADGNFYLRVQLHVEPAIRKFNAAGIQKALFKPSSISELNVRFTSYFSVRAGGEIDQLVFPSNSEDSYVVTFKSDGTYKSKAKLQPGFNFRPFQLATLPSGQWLVAGLRNGNAAIELGAAAAAPDGNIYVMRRLSRAIIYAISPSGDVVSRFSVDPGNHDFHPVSMQVAGNRIAVLFFKSHADNVVLPEDLIMKVVDLEGHSIATYDQIGKSGIGIGFVCYVPVRDEFTFVTTTKDKFLGFAIAKPR